MEISFSNDGLIGIGILFGIVIMLFLIIREIRLMKTNNRRLELELEREKLSVLTQGSRSPGPSLTQLTDEQIDSLRTIDQINTTLNQDVFTKQKLVEGRIQKLEKMIKTEKLDRMLTKIQNEEKKIV